MPSRRCIINTGFSGPLFVVPPSGGATALPLATPVGPHALSAARAGDSRRLDGTGLLPPAPADPAHAPVADLDDPVAVRRRHCPDDLAGEAVGLPGRPPVV